MPTFGRTRRAYRATDEPLKAREALERAIALTPDDGEAWMVLGLTALDLKDVPAAQHAFDTAGSVDPELKQLAGYNRAVSEIQAGDLRTAETTLEQVIELDPLSLTARHAQTLLDRLRDHLNASYRPEQVSRTTGVSSVVIRRMARELSAAKSATQRLVAASGAAWACPGSVLARARRISARR